MNQWKKAQISHEENELQGNRKWEISEIEGNTKSSETLQRQPVLRSDNFYRQISAKKQNRTDVKPL